ncbi:MAG: succinylglutamate desuccinylase/aspartoacylase family protein [Deltaproteobacteria bacterium]|nr:succinylglutamate desuccinylase/aspartoacylase family protein [Deltaproteobacteria bacterium]
MFIKLLALALLAQAQASIFNDKYVDVQRFMRQLAVMHSDVVELVTVGSSDSGQVIEGLKIGSGPVAHLVVATHHGNEYGATEVAKALAESLAAAPLPGLTVYVVPVLNIYGYDLRKRNEDTPNSVLDPNRDYPGPCGTEGPFLLKSTGALARFLAERNIVAAATLHTFHPAVVYPWGFGTKDFDPPNLDVFLQLVRAATVESKYPIGNSTDVIYPARGTFEDYAFSRFGIWALLFELGHTHKPYENEVADLIHDNIPGLRRLLGIAPKTRALSHSFTGKCDSLAFLFDRHEE